MSCNFNGTRGTVHECPLLKGVWEIIHSKDYVREFCVLVAHSTEHCWISCVLHAVG